MYTTQNLGEPQQRGDCSGWEKDPQSFSKRVAEHYARTVLGQSLSAQSIRPPQQNSVRWEVVFPDDIVVAVIFAKDFVAVGRIYTDPIGPIRHYNYSCTPSGELVLEERKLSGLMRSPATSRNLSQAQMGEPPPGGSCSNALDARAQAIITAAQDQSVPIADRAVRAIWSIIRTYYPSQAGKVTSVVYNEPVSGLVTQRSGWGPGATGTISVGRYFLQRIANFARRVLQTGHELVHIDQYRQSMTDQTEREFLAHCWTALMPEIQGTGCVRAGDRLGSADCALRFWHCLSPQKQTQYRQHHQTLLNLRQSLNATTSLPAACNRDEIRRTC